MNELDIYETCKRTQRRMICFGFRDLAKGIREWLTVMHFLESFIHLNSLRKIPKIHNLHIISK